MAFISPKVLHCGQTGVQAESEVALVAHLQAEPAGPGWRPAKPFCLEGFRGQRSCCSLLWEPKNLGQVRSQPQLSPLQTLLAAQLSVILESQGHRPVFPPGTQPSFRESLGAHRAASPCGSPLKPLCFDAHL